MIQSKSLVLIRHGETDFSSESAVERLRGWLNIPLNQDGIREAGATARLLRNVPFTKIYTSSLIRAKDTARIIQRTLATTQKRMIPVIITVSLYPWNMGQLQGQPMDNVESIMLDYMKHPTIKVPEGESFATFITRFLSFFRRTLNEAKTKGPILLVSHTRCLRAADAWYLGGQHSNNYIDDKPLMEKKHLYPGEGLIFTWHGNSWDRQVLKNPVSERKGSSKKDGNK